MIEQGSNVKLHYTLTVDGEALDSSRDREPLSYVHGQGQLVPGLERQLEGMQAGDRKNATVLPEEGYGPHRPEALHDVPRSAFSNASDLKAGDRVSGQAQGQAFEATITAVMNHPLAGKTLEFDVEIVEVG
jgi:FKBP-type peptidyl-prolyl cis-trans isomerase SlyD